MASPTSSSEPSDVRTESASSPLSSNGVIGEPELAGIPTRGTGIVPLGTATTGSAIVRTGRILLAPLPNVKPKVWQYSEEQEAKTEELRAYAKTLMLPETDAYYPNEKKWLEDPGCAARYMRASKWRLEEAKRRIKGTLEWRREYKPDIIPADEVKEEALTGKIILNGFDNEGRPIMYLRPGMENTKESPRQIRHLVFHIERAIDLMPSGQESMACLVDYNSTTLRNSPSISNGRKFLSIVQNHYVERLGKAIVVNLPALLNFFFKGISPFLDPVTRDKQKFNPNLLDLFPANQLDASLPGGEYQYEYDHEIYWSMLCKRCGVRPDGSRCEPSTIEGPEIEVVTSSPMLQP
ncbi:CRAL/TRIO domain-containing protein [Cantharellus anzutake]|uniref:CRAL/TRIO domain-containing protein n=1 Tax=Cantharellus anzutake TaxID=1750568 RepID=UPI001903DB12|nr:CRAL/TRIO domain-containing protein [Cantharellus anzutake]KAF8336292.1 CRAL/TRIO domain-containing protein [Cantharellus anzutake]